MAWGDDETTPGGSMINASMQQAQQRYLEVKQEQKRRERAEWQRRNETFAVRTHAGLSFITFGDEILPRHLISAIEFFREDLTVRMAGSYQVDLRGPMEILKPFCARLRHAWVTGNVLPIEPSIKQGDKNGTE